MSKLKKPHPSKSSPALCATDTQLDIINRSQMQDVTAVRLLDVCLRPESCVCVIVRFTVGAALAANVVVVVLFPVVRSEWYSADGGAYTQEDNCQGRGGRSE